MFVFFTTILLLVIVLFSVDAVVIFWHVGLEPFMAPMWAKLPGGPTYWFLVRKGK